MSLEIKGFSHWRMGAVWRPKPFVETDWQHLPFGKSEVKWLAWDRQPCLIHASHSAPHIIFFLERHCIKAVTRNYTADWDEETNLGLDSVQQDWELQKTTRFCCRTGREHCVSQQQAVPIAEKGSLIDFSLSITVFPHSDAWNCRKYQSCLRKIAYLS